MADRILLTGGTGFLGTELAARLTGRPDTQVYVLVRAVNEEEAIHRLKGAWYHDKALYASIGKTCIPVTGDFTQIGLGLSEEDRNRLLEQVTTVIHAGAEIGFQKSREELLRTNCEGTRNVLTLAGEMKKLRRFVHISTAYVAGTAKGVVREESPAGTAFSSYYEESKAEAEKLVRTSGLPYTICRPGMIVGDSRTGWVRNFNTIYYVLKMMLLGKMRALPIRQDAPLNIVPGDYVADCVAKISFDEDAAGRTFHLTCPEEMAPRAGELAEYVREWASRNLHIHLAKPVYMTLPALKQAGLVHNKKESGRKKDFLRNMLTLLPYFYGEQSFDRTNTDRICGAYEPAWREYIGRLLAFACRKNFMRQTGQTVFEQAQVRRDSTRYPIYYYDITAEGMRRMAGPEANRRIRRIQSALYAWGIRKGDRIAITGINSIAYMLLEQAIGLMGAVSVPIYYTTPAAEASLLLEKSGASWFFVGDKRMMEHIDAVTTSARIVSFSAGQDVKHEKVMRWKRFMKKAGGEVPAQYPSPDDLATIRYTSGTIGEPKGVMFNNAQLAWMGEVMTDLLTWEDRNSSMHYLSFLPLSHVVEGILASYAPYYLLSEVHYYYLNDFGALTAALPKVRPTVFFSVPRFYEKVWDQAASNKIGQAWLAAEEGPVKTALGAILKKAVLRKAGIDRCKQLIVGSAPVSEALLLHFRELGIEVHNAYGQTEAPLITINRMGDNVIPTIGTALPETTITAEEDGELIVEGPQVTLGYYGLETENIRNGVLRTGDLGRIDDNGHITLFGRKKDFIITAYGKNISIPKIEQRLKDIQGVSEAVLIGENRPYCTALLWLEKENAYAQEGKDDEEQVMQTGKVGGELDAQIVKMNEGLSHPEQIRRYRVIAKPLRIQDGELTPNLKVKRDNVEAHYASEIEEMYR